uniref:Uncharacterized protein n=1 Tax=Tetranychus urticae TaxID=32264 RepID=T1K211_TETUR
MRHPYIFISRGKFIPVAGQVKRLVSQFLPEIIIE